MAYTSWPMNMRLAIHAMAVMFLAQAIEAQTPVGTAFTHQGRLIQSGTPADGEFDFEFRLFDAATEGNQHGPIVVLDDVAVNGGLFAVELDFGAEVFAGDARWLEIRVRPGAETGGFTLLHPLQRLTPTPHALHAASAETATEAATAADADQLGGLTPGEYTTDLELGAGLAGKADLSHPHGFQDLTGEVTDAQVPDDITIDNATMAALAGDADLLDGMDSDAFATVRHNHDAADLNSGVLDDARLSADIARVGDIMTTVLANDGAGSGLDADTLDGMDASELISAAGDIQGLVHAFPVAPGEAVTPGDAVSLVPGSAQIRKGYEREGFGDAVVFNDGLTQWMTMALLSPDKFVIAYRDAPNSNAGAAIVGEVSGTEVSFGDEQVFNNVLTSSIACAALSPTKFVVAYLDSAGPGGGKAIIGEVTGTDIVYGSEVDFDLTNTFYLAVTALSSDRFVVAFHDGSNLDFGTAIVGSVSGTDITFGPKAIFNEADTGQMSLAALTSSQFVVAYQNQGFLSEPGVARLGSLSVSNPGDPPSLTFGPETFFNHGETRPISVAPLSADRCAIAFTDRDNSGFGNIVRGDVSQDSLRFGLPVVFNQEQTDAASVVSLTSDQVMIVYRTRIGVSVFNVGGATTADVVGSNFIFGFSEVFKPQGAQVLTSLALTSDKVAVAYEDTQNFSSGTVQVARVLPSSLIGVAREGATEGQTAPVTLLVDRGISDAHSQLTSGMTYYAQPDGSITTDRSGISLGIAISPTEIVFLSR